ncbi:MAG TPA: hypothetical protein VID27_18020 [Blastocatellia bacterium]|jgi:hypothetical protein
MPDIEIRFDDDGIEFLRYPYPPSSVYPSGKIAYASIIEIDADAAPPEIRTEREILFISATMKEELRRAASANAIPAVRRIDVWGLLLEPFLDTEFDREDKERTLRLLEESGILRDESVEIRRSVTRAMEAYNFDSMLWDWCHLGLADVLDAFRGVLSGPRHRLPPDEYEAFYWRAMEIARKGKIIGYEKAT